ncbi:hypothetical protein ACOMHN_005416 [Nucella lapillus]
MPPMISQIPATPRFFRVPTSFSQRHQDSTKSLSKVHPTSTRFYQIPGKVGAMPQMFSQCSQGSPNVAKVLPMPQRFSQCRKGSPNVAKALMTPIFSQCCMCLGRHIYRSWLTRTSPTAAPE